LVQLRNATSPLKKSIILNRIHPSQLKVQRANSQVQT